jgi:integrase/recombinase XerD
VRSYRDTFVLLLRFVATRKECSVPELDVDHLGPEEVLDFLHDLEVERHNIAATRNVRLAAIHAFFRYCAAQHPERIGHCQRILAVPFKRTRSRAVEYLEFAEIQAVLAAIDRSTRDGRGAGEPNLREFEPHPRVPCGASTALGRGARRTSRLDASAC